MGLILVSLLSSGSASRRAFSTVENRQNALNRNNAKIISKNNTKLTLNNNKVYWEKQLKLQYCDGLNWERTVCG